MYYVYMLKNHKNQLYAGVTRDAEKRLHTHNTKQGALFTKTNGKFHTVFLEEHETLAQARTREIQIKKWRREKKENLIQRFANGQPSVMKKTGFTLIELLVVISIISLLASIVFASLNSARTKARDARRKADLTQLRLALELYFDSNNAYPSLSGSWYSSEPGDGNGNNNGGNWIVGLTPQYISTLPRDPSGGSRPCPVVVGLRAYLYTANPGQYKLLSHCGPEGTMSTSDPFYDPIRPTWAWMVCSSPIACAW